MTKIYSHSRISTFEQCPLKFKFRYIDKIKPKKTLIESFLGRIIHSTLEWLYKQVKKNKTPTIGEFIKYYSDNWEKNYKPSIEIVKKDLTAKEYFNKGVQFLINYYIKHKPFEDNTLEVEKRIMLDLDKNGEYKIQGFIDRLVHNLEKNELEIHDYKTANNLPKKEKIDNDRQLALYSIAVKELFGKEKEVLLVWHYLNYNKTIYSRRTKEELERLKEDTLTKIKQIESTKEFPAKVSCLCDWCEYKSICPEFNNRGEAGEE